MLVEHHYRIGVPARYLASTFRYWPLLVRGLGCGVRWAGMSARFLSTWPCQDACGTLRTDELVEGAPVYRCPGCDTTWIELDERTELEQPAGPSAGPTPEPEQT